MKSLLFLILCCIYANFSFAQKKQSKIDEALKTHLKCSVKTIRVHELARNFSDYVILDAREKKEYEVSHLKNAIRIGFSTPDFNVVEKLPKNTPIVVYCSIGVRSEKIGEKLLKMGYTNVQNLYGSIFEWINSGHEVYDSNGKATSKIHAYDTIWGQCLKKGQKVY